MPLTIDSVKSEGLADLFSLRKGVASNTLANGTLALTIASAAVQHFTGSTSGQIVKLPDATTVSAGHLFTICNAGSAPLVVQDGAASQLLVLPGGFRVNACLLVAGSQAGSWAVDPTGKLKTQSLSDDADFSTSARSYTLVTGFSLTPGAGSYLVFCSFQATVGNSGAEGNLALFKGGSVISTSERQIFFNGALVSNYQYAPHIHEEVMVDGTEAIDLRCFASSGSVSIQKRKLTLLWLGY